LEEPDNLSNKYIERKEHEMELYEQVEGKASDRTEFDDAQ
jgi:hypothetical protein